jgi:transcriptional regulator GlxA family with amidase domain
MRLRQAVVLGVLAGLAGCQTTWEDVRRVPEAEGGALRVGFLIVDGIYNSELMAPYDVFQHTIFHTEPGMEVFTVAPSVRPVRSFEGLEIVPHYTFRTAPPIDVLVVPSAEHSMDSDLENEELMSWVRRVGADAQYVVSLCDGAFVLAAAGLLDGLESTTFPGDIAAYRERFPELTVHAGVSFVHDGRAITSAGGAKSYDPAMYLCEVLFGVDVARGIGGGLVIDWDATEIPHVTVGAE